MARTRRNRPKQGPRSTSTSRPARPPRPDAPVRPAPVPPGLVLVDMLNVQEETDETGRLLLEDSAPDAAQERARGDGITMRTETCPYRDTPSRLGGQMNSSAYEALRHDTAEMLNGFAWLNSHYVDREPSWRSTVRGLFDVTHLGLTLPLLLFRRGKDAVHDHGQLPTYVASMFKASRGVFSASVDMLNKRAGAPPATDVEEVVAFAEREGHLARVQTGRVCAAPTRLIERTIGVILTGEGGDAAQSRLGDLIEFATLWDFYRLQDAFNEAFSIYRFHLNSVMASGVHDPTELFAQTVAHPSGRRPLGALTEDLLQLANTTQRGLNRLLGRSERARPVTFETLLEML